ASLKRLHLAVPSALAFRENQHSRAFPELGQDRLQTFLGHPLLIDRNGIKTGDVPGKEGVTKERLAGQIRQPAMACHRGDGRIEEALVVGDEQHRSGSWQVAPPFKAITPTYVQSAKHQGVNEVIPALAQALGERRTPIDER